LDAARAPPSFRGRPGDGRFAADKSDPPRTGGPRENGLASCEANPLIHMARLAGFEPTTPWFVAKYSIQLSYSRRARDYISTGPALSRLGDDQEIGAQGTRLRVDAEDGDHHAFPHAEAVGVIGQHAAIGVVRELVAQ